MVVELLLDHFHVYVALMFLCLIAFTYAEKPFFTVQSKPTQRLELIAALKREKSGEVSKINRNEMTDLGNEDS